jgi:hypothetical protein
MTHPVSVRLDEDVQATLETAARESGVGLSTYLRDLAISEAKRVRTARIRAQSRAVGGYVAASREGRDFYEDWGSPNSKGKAE